ncbi:MAG: hypothetical protein ACLS38_16785, partial [Phocaeicola coprophilus]
IHENQPKGARINSLTYLLYSEEGTLEKRREIPGLDTDGESWPLRRENMSWEQREALKDTLSQGETYHAVFVANIDSAVCGWTGADGQPWSPLRETGTYETVYLQMPFQPFNDRNMFYVFHAGHLVDGSRCRSGESLQLSGRVAACGDPYRLLV